MIVPRLVLLLSAVLSQRASGPEPLPLVVVAPSPGVRVTGTLAILLTGDGGWSQVDKSIAKKLSTDGDAVVALNSLHYFQHQRTSAGVAADITALARSECVRWSCQHLVLIGYSMGADVLPFIINQLGDDVRAKLAQVDLISLGHNAVFKFFPTQWVGLELGRKFATLPQLDTIRNVNIVCIYGTSDRDAACTGVTGTNAEVVPLPSGHVMTKVADILADTLAQRVRNAASHSLLPQ